MSLENLQKFSSFSDLESAVRNYTIENKIHLYKRDARTLEAASTRIKGASSANRELVYYSIKYACVHGGRQFKKTKDCRGERSTKTMKCGCTCFLQFVLSKDGSSLELTGSNLTHNHPVSDALYKMNYLERRLPKDVQKRAGELLNMKVNKKMLQAKLSDETGKVILMKDLSNIAARYKCPPEDVDKIPEILKNDYGCCANVLYKDDALQAVFFQDQHMSKSFCAFPEILFIDGAYKLLNNRFMCYLFLIEDGNGNCEVVAVSLVAHKDKDSIHWMIETFQELNSMWEETRVIITDKDLVKKNFLDEKFPDAHLLISKFYVLKVFKREVTAEKLGIRPEEAIVGREFLNKLCYAKSDDNYSKLYKDFKTKVSPVIVEYFNKNWRSTFKEWIRLASFNETFLNTKNSQVETINTQLKSIVKPHSTLTAFIHNFFILLASLRKERDCNIADSMLKVPTVISPSEPIILKYETYMMPFAMNFLRKEYQFISLDLIHEVSPDNYSYLLKGQLFPVNSDTCSCTLFKYIKIPCRHILSVRKQMGLSLYDEDLVAQRWSRNYMQRYQKFFLDQLTVEEMANIYCKDPTDNEPRTKSDKLRLAQIFMTKMANFIEDSSDDEFEKRMNLLENVLQIWKANKEVCVVCAGDPFFDSGMPITDVSLVPYTSVILTTPEMPISSTIVPSTSTEMPISSAIEPSTSTDEAVTEIENNSNLDETSNLNESNFCIDTSVTQDSANGDSNDVDLNTRKRKRSDSITDAALETLISIKNKKEEEEDIYGQYIAKVIKSFNPLQKDLCKLEFEKTIVKLRHNVDV